MTKDHTYAKDFLFTLIIMPRRPAIQGFWKQCCHILQRHFGNAASKNHAYGWQAEEAVKYGREQVAKLIGAESQEIIFTSGATESDNLALKGVFETYVGKGNHIITCNIEHRAVLDPCRHLEKLGAEITYLEVKSDGLIDLDELETIF